jgi:hypothetical protein
MKLFITSLLFVFATTAFAQSKCDSIVWNANRKLTWDDFKADPYMGIKTAARTHYDFNRTWSAKGFTLTTKMICSFSPCKSWSKNKQSDNLLTHEQGHFDIAEYFRRVYNKRIAEATYSRATLPLILRNVYRNVNMECQQMQEMYDTETTHSLKREEQTQWIKKIAGVLDSVKDYDKEEVVVDLPKN